MLGALRERRKCLLQNNNHNTKHKKILIAGVPSSHALPGYFIIAPPSVCVPDVIGALACGFQTKKKKKHQRCLPL